MYQISNSVLEILALYTGDYKRQLYLREISRLSKIPLRTTQNILNRLEESKVLKSIVRGKNKYFSLNLLNVQTKYCILQSEIYRTLLFLENNPQFKLFLKNVEGNSTIIVFGSFAKGTAEQSSDADILIVSDVKCDLPQHLIPNKIHKIELSENAFMESVKKQETLIKEVEDHHVILNSHSFYVSSMWSYYAN